MSPEEQAAWLKPEARSGAEAGHASSCASAEGAQGGREVAERLDRMPGAARSGGALHTTFKISDLVL